MKWLITNPVSGKPWNGRVAVEEPLGGSEYASAAVAKALVDAGEEVTVVAHGEPGVYEGVSYITHEMLHGMVQMYVDARSGSTSQPVYTDMPYDVLVVCREPAAVESAMRANVSKLYWTMLHDLPSQPGQLFGHRLLVLSKYQATWWLGPDASQWPKQAAMTSNGINPDYFSGEELRDPTRLIYTSNPDRGLYVTACVFQEIRKRWPDMELHVYGRAGVYGWLEQAEAPYMPTKRIMEHVFVHDPLPRKDLARELMRSWAMLYCSTWPETYCMAALEAQAAGTPVICPPYAALIETVKGGVVTHDFVNAVSQLRNKGKWDKVSRAGKEFAAQHTWAKVAQQWIQWAKEDLGGGA